MNFEEVNDYTLHILNFTTTADSCKFILEFVSGHKLMETEHFKVSGAAV